MGRPPKPHLQLITEKKSHRTKAELELREKAEKSLLTGSPLREWQEVKDSPVAHKEFARLKKLLKIIKHDDALHEAIINRYCLLLAECKDFEVLKNRLMDDLNELIQSHSQGEVKLIKYMELKSKLQDQVMVVDRKIMDRRKMMLSIEKENLLTIASALRAIPKKPEENQDSPMAEFLRRKVGVRDAP